MNSNSILYIVECKRHTKTLNVKFIDSLYGMMVDAGINDGIIVSPFGFTKGAINRSKQANIEPIIITLKDEKRLNLRELMRLIFPWDEHQHPIMGNATDAFINDEDYFTILDEMDGIMYEEWEELIKLWISNEYEKCVNFLKFISIDHDDDGWRFNAIRILDENRELDDDLILKIKEKEEDPEILEYLKEAIEFQH